MRIVPGLRELDDYYGLPGKRRGPLAAQLVSFLLTAAVSVSAGFGALALVENSLTRSIDRETLERALPGLKVDSTPLTDALKGLWPSEPEKLEPVPDAQPVRSTFGQRKVAPPLPQTGDAPQTHRIEEAQWRATDGGIKDAERPNIEWRRWRTTTDPSPTARTAGIEDPDPSPDAGRDPIRPADRSTASL